MTRGPRLFYALGAGVVGCAVIALVTLTLAHRRREHREARARKADVAAGPRVQVAVVKASPEAVTLHLQGDARPFKLVTLYAKVSGYLREISVDKGDHVHKGQVLARIEAPETDRQYDAARADAYNKRLIARRSRLLAGRDFVSVQDAEVAETQARIAEEQARAAHSQKGYEVLRAPFDGVVVARFADPGALLQAATGAQTGALGVVQLAETTVVRVYVYVDQRDASTVRVGDSAEITPPELGARPLQGHVTRMAGQLDPRTRMLLVELDVDNRDGRLLAGGYVDVALRVRRPSLPELPSQALVMRAAKPFLAALDADNHVHYHPVTVLDDDGQTVRFTDGVKPGDRVALGLGDTIPDGAHVQPVQPR